MELTNKQKDILEIYHKQGVKSINDLQEEDLKKFENLKDYETLYQDINRFLMGLTSSSMVKTPDNLFI